MHLTPEAAARQEQSERDPLPPQEAQKWMSDQEKRDGEMLVEITGADFDHAVRILRKHDNDMAKAADTLLTALSGATEDAEERERLASLENIKQDFGHLFPSKSNNVIDLTGDDDPPTNARFRATTRSPDPSWQMVRTTQPDVKSADDQLDDVIRASYNDFAADESDNIIPPEDFMVREAGRPVALRADVAGNAYAALVIQSLFHVPQLRQRCAELHLHHVEDASPRTNPDWAIWNLIEMLTCLDLVQLNIILDTTTLASWETVPLVHGMSVGTASKNFLERVVNALQSELDQQKVEGPNTNRLLHFTYCRVHSPTTGPPETVNESDFGHVVTVEINPESPSNDLVTRLSETLNTYNDDGSSDHTLILQPSEMVTFEIIVGASSSTATLSPEPLVYPKCIYMDQFLATNLDLANETRDSQRQFQKDIEMLTEKRKRITFYEGLDTFENLRGAIDYYDHIAQRDDPERIATLATMATKLRTTLQKLEREVEAIDQKIGNLQTELAGLFDNPELQCYPYDLRAVLVHTGLPGRKHIYSYVQDKGTWWKTVDYTVTEVTEDLVLSDPAGLHLGAGPYMLMYSRRQTEAEMAAPLQWPPLFVDSVKSSAEVFLEAIQEEARKAAVVSNDL
ncbi:hypothetical protein DFH07DRAFT_825142 [Mycena maculata]|uniref:USP domain-containing protein n=1 Tax=Mycena maculata TaxID=230809 RepID=A0AAD7IY67_9AGAR|nr:hypothetical protein DFH07DRAFT_825142 [Mycena maculata]